MSYGKVALGIDGFNYEEIKKDIHALEPDRTDVVNTPDNTYLLFYWECIGLEEEKSKRLFAKINEIRHSFIFISDEGEVTVDNRISDQYGCDEEFDELLSWKGDICIWGDETDIFECGVTKDRTWKILRKIVCNEIREKGEAAGRKMLHEAGVTLEETIDLDLAHLFPTQTFEKHSDWTITMEELNEILSFVDYSAVIDENDMISLNNVQRYDDNEGLYFQSPQEVISFFDGSDLFEDHFMNGEICCNYPEDFISYEQARDVARKTGYHKVADILELIIKALKPSVFPLQNEEDEPINPYCC